MATRKAELKPYHDLSGWSQQDRAYLAALAERDEGLKANIDIQQAMRDEVRGTIKEFLKEHEVPAGARLAVGDYEIEDREGNAPAKVDLATLETFYPEAYQATVTEGGKRYSMYVRRLKGEG